MGKNVTVKVSVLYFLSLIPIVGWVVSGFSQLWLAPVLLFGFPLVGLSSLLLGAYLLVGTEQARMLRNAGDSTGEPKTIRRRVA